MLSLLLGVVLGGISGYFGGIVDTVIQRIIEILRSIPTIPLWMALAAALPRDWSRSPDLFRHHHHPLDLRLDRARARGARPLPGAARGGFRHGGRALSGASRPRIIFRHMVPSFFSHIIAARTLAIPEMIIAETALSFLGLGLRPPAISYGVMLQAAQNIQTIATTPWLMVPALPVIILVLVLQLPRRRPARRGRSLFASSGAPMAVSAASLGAQSEDRISCSTRAR